MEDSDYVERANILEEQYEFARNDLVNNLLVEFMYIFDKGYRCIVAALLAGAQKCVQPLFAQSDQLRQPGPATNYPSDIQKPRG